MINKYIKVYGARANNLKNIDVQIPRDKLVVFTGLSGSGKSSLAFDTIRWEQDETGVKVHVAVPDGVKVHVRLCCFGRTIDTVIEETHDYRLSRE